MSYSSWSVVFGEQPTASKWNILGTNDASFNNGSGIASLTIGSVTAVKNDYKFSVYRNAAWTSGTPVKVSYDTKAFDTGANYDASTNFRFNAPIAGFYFFSSSFSASAGSGTLLLAYIYKNGSIALGGSEVITGGASTAGANVSGLLQLAAGDYIEGYAYNGGAGVTGIASTYLHGFLVSAT